MAIGDDDLDLIFDSGDFNVDVTFDLSPDDLTIQGIFNEPSDATAIGGIAIEAVKPSVTVKTADLTAAVKQGVSVAIGSRSFKVAEINKTGSPGMTDIILKTA